MTIVRGHTADLFLDRATADARNGRINVRYFKAIGCNFTPGRDENTNAQVSVSTACCVCPSKSRGAYDYEDDTRLITHQR